VPAGIDRAGQLHHHAVDEDLSAIRPDSPDQGLDQRALARPVVADERDDLAGERGEVRAVQCLHNRTSVAALRHLGPLSASLAFVGFDDFELADLLSPGVTVVAQNVARLGRAAAELLFRRLAGDHGPAERIEVATRLIPRGSGELPPPAC